MVTPFSICLLPGVAKRTIRQPPEKTVPLPRQLQRDLQSKLRQGGWLSPSEPWPQPGEWSSLRAQAWVVGPLLGPEVGASPIRTSKPENSEGMVPTEMLSRQTACWPQWLHPMVYYSGIKTAASGVGNVSSAMLPQYGQLYSPEIVKWLFSSHSQRASLGKACRGHLGFKFRWEKSGMGYIWVLQSWLLIKHLCQHMHVLAFCAGYQLNSATASWHGMQSCEIQWNRLTSWKHSYSFDVHVKTLRWNISGYLFGNDIIWRTKIYAGLRTSW